MESGNLKIENIKGLIRRFVYQWFVKQLLITKRAQKYLSNINSQLKICKVIGFGGKRLM